MTDTKQNPDPRCPKCGFTMCEQFDDKVVSPVLTMAVPNGDYRCYHCSGVKPRPAAPSTDDPQTLADRWG